MTIWNRTPRQPDQSGSHLSAWARWLAWAGLGLVLLAVIAGVIFRASLAAGVQEALLAIAVISVLALRRDVWSAAFLIGVMLLVDWYQIVPVPHSLYVVALVGALALLALVWYSRRWARPWRSLRDVWLWALFVLLVAVEIPQSLNHLVAVIYWVQIAVTACVFWALGTMIAPETSRVRLLWSLLAALATLVAIHSIIQSTTGVFLLETAHQASYLASPPVNDFRLAGSHAIRASSFLQNPDSDGAFFALLLFLPAGLALSSGEWRARVLYGVEVVIIVVALLFTFTAAAWIASACGAVVFVLLSARSRYRVRLLAGAVALVALTFVVFHHQAQLLLHHAVGASELGLRQATWETALRAIAAHPLTGIGLGTGAPYITRSRPYLVAYGTESPRVHPHNSFLELAAMAGIPVLLVFLVILARALLRAARNYQHADWELRPLLGAAFAGLTALTVHAFADATWTLPVLVPIAWLIVGVIASPLLSASTTGDVSGTMLEGTASVNVPGARHDTPPVVPARQADTLAHVESGREAASDESEPGRS